MKVMERMIDKLIREQAKIDSMQFGFMKGCGTTDAIFILRQLQEKYMAKNKKLYFAFVDLEKPLTEYLERFCGGHYAKWALKSG